MTPILEFRDVHAGYGPFRDCRNVVATDHQSLALNLTRVPARILVSV